LKSEIDVTQKSSVIVSKPLLPVPENPAEQTEGGTVRMSDSGYDGHQAAATPTTPTTPTGKSTPTTPVSKGRWQVVNYSHSATASGFHRLNYDRT
jgi:hypothetical protein